MFKLKLIRKEFVHVKDEYGHVEIEVPMQFKDLDDVFNVLGYLLEGNRFKPVKIEITEVEDEQND